MRLPMAEQRPVRRVERREVALDALLHLFMTGKSAYWIGISGPNHDNDRCTSGSRPPWARPPSRPNDCLTTVSVQPIPGGERQQPLQSRHRPQGGGQAFPSKASS